MVVASVTQQWAILIGINSYPEPQQTLKACVRDIDSIQHFLLGTSKEIDVQRLTAGESDKSGSSSILNRRPTRESLFSAFERVLEMGNAGDNVYIHFSGHGTTIESAQRRFGKPIRGDLALVLLANSTDHECAYFRGEELVDYLLKLANKNMTTTLVLDCCFSGDVARHGNGSSIRGLKYRPEIDEKYPQVSSARHHDTPFSYSVTRDARMWPNWVVDPRGYTVLTACTPDERSYEREVGPEKTLHGVLSWNLERTLKKLGTNRYRMRELYEHLCAQFIDITASQTPMFYGNPQVCLFGTVQEQIALPLVLVKSSATDVTSTTLTLQAGEVHGISLQDEFALYPFFKEANTGEVQNSITVRVTGVGPTTSTLELLDTTKSSLIRTGWTAEPIILKSIMKYIVRVDSILSARQDWKEAVFSPPYLCLETDETMDNQDPYCFSLSLDNNESSNVRIKDKDKGYLQNLPSLRCDNPIQIMNVLNQLTMYRLVQDLENKTAETDFRKSFTVTLLNAAEAALEDLDGTGYKVRDGECIYIQFHQCLPGERALYIHVFDLGPRWQIDNLLPGNFEFRKLHKTIGTPLRKLPGINMYVPKLLQSQGGCDDVIKVLVTSRPTSLRCFERGALIGESEPQSDRDCIRGHDRDEEIIKLGSGIDVEDEWTSFSFRIRTSTTIAT